LVDELFFLDIDVEDVFLQVALLARRLLSFLFLTLFEVVLQYLALVGAILHQSVCLYNKSDHLSKFILYRAYQGRLMA
jgi:uncharacterized membrane protein